MFLVIQYSACLLCHLKYCGLSFLLVSLFVALVGQFVPLVDLVSRLFFLVGPGFRMGLGMGLSVGFGGFSIRYRIIGFGTDLIWNLVCDSV